MSVYMDKYTIDPKMTFEVDSFMEVKRCRSGYVKVRKIVLDRPVPEMRIVDGVLHETV